MADVTTEIQKLYVAYFNRPADPAGLAFWSAALAGNSGAYDGIARDFARSQEYMAGFSGMTNRTAIDVVYQHLFGRNAEQAGVDYWASLLDRKTLTIDTIIAAMAQGAQGTDKIVLDGRVAVATAFTSHVDTAAERLAYSGPAANTVAAAYLSSVMDAQTAASALLPENIDAVITRLAGPVVMPMTNAVADVIGVPPAHWG
jgi:hypothetical protein